MYNFSTEFILQIFYAALLNTIIVYGVLETLKKMFFKFFLLDKSIYVGIVLTYVGGFLCTIFFQFDIMSVQILTGLVIGCLATALYKAMVKQVLSLPEKIVNKIFDE